MSKEGAALIQHIKKRGYLFDDQNNCYEPPGSVRFNELQLIDTNTRANKNKAAKGLKSSRVITGWIDDTRNISNRDKQIDMFIALIKQVLGLIVWPEFYFTTDRMYRFDYAIPIAQDNNILMIAIEVDGGIWARGASGHSSGKGIQRDMDKSTLANVSGWTLLRVVPSDLCTQRTIDLITKAIDYKTQSGAACATV